MLQGLEWGIRSAKIFRRALREQAPDVFGSNANPILARQENGVESSFSPTKERKRMSKRTSFFFGGENGIRTHETG